MYLGVMYFHFFLGSNLGMRLWSCGKCVFHDKNCFSQYFTVVSFIVCSII